MLPGQRLALARVFATQLGFLLMAEPRDSMGKEPARIWGAQKRSIEIQLLL